MMVQEEVAVGEVGGSMLGIGNNGRYNEIRDPI